MTDRPTITAEDLDAPDRYAQRSRHVYWYRMPACRAKAGHDKATCLLTPDHPGPHRGNGFDQFGPKGDFTWDGPSAE